MGTIFIFYYSLLLLQNIAADSSNQDGSLHHNGITVNFDTEDCELGINNNILFYLNQASNKHKNEIIHETSNKNIEV